MYVKDRLRRSMMFVPGNNPGMIRDAHIYGADSIMFDLEDSVAYTEKDSARFLVYNALKTLHFGTKETVVRINDLSSGLGVQDLEAVVRAGVQVVRLPKTDSAQDVIDCEREIQRIERQAGIPVGATGMMAAIESANGVLHAAEIAHASDPPHRHRPGSRGLCHRSENHPLRRHRAAVRPLHDPQRRPVRRHCRPGHGVFRRQQ